MIKQQRPDFFNVTPGNFRIDGRSGRCTERCQSVKPDRREFGANNRSTEQRSTHGRKNDNSPTQF